MLHLIESQSGLAKCKPHIRKNDVVVFLGNGVLYAEVISYCQCFAIEDDVARCTVMLPADITQCTHAKLLELVIKETSSTTWH